MYAEVFKPIYFNGDKTKYEASNFGNIRNADTGKLMKLRIDKDGYYRVGLWCNDGKQHNFLVHRLVLDAFHPNELNDITNQVNHKDSNRRNNTICNLEAVSAKDNVKHSILYGYRDNSGVNSYLHKYDTNTIHMICRMLETGHSSKNISKTLNIPESTISNIKRGSEWVSISSQYNIPPCNKRKNIDIVHDICKYIADGKTNTDIAKLCDVDHKYVSLIRRGKRHYKILKMYMCDDET